MRDLDVGSGVAKFFLVGACTSEGAFEGIEQRRSLVDIAREQNFELTSGPWCQIDDTLRYSRELQNTYIECGLAAPVRHCGCEKIRVSID